MGEALDRVTVRDIIGSFNFSGLYATHSEIALETGLAAGGALLALGLAGTISGIAIWGGSSFGPLDFQKMMHWSSPRVWC